MTHPTANGIGKCITTSDRGTYLGKGKGKPCVFPFIYGGKKYSSCQPENNYLWCPTEVGKQGEYIGKWGKCDGKCPKQGNSFVGSLNVNS